MQLRTAMMLHNYNPCYSGSRGRRDDCTGATLQLETTVNSGQTNSNQNIQLWAGEFSSEQGPGPCTQLAGG